MNVLQNIAYTAKATATGGREGSAKSDDGRLDVTSSRNAMKSFHAVMGDDKEAKIRIIDL